MTKRRFIRVTEKKDKRQTCHMDCYEFPHRMSGGRCKFDANGRYKDGHIDLPPSEPDEEFPF